MAVEMLLIPLAAIGDLIFCKGRRTDRQTPDGTQTGYKKTSAEDERHLLVQPGDCRLQC